MSAVGAKDGDRYRRQWIVESFVAYDAFDCAVPFRINLFNCSKHSLPLRNWTRVTAAVQDPRAVRFRIEQEEQIAFSFFPIKTRPAAVIRLVHDERCIERAAQEFCGSQGVERARG